MVGHKKQEQIELQRLDGVRVVARTFKDLLGSEDYFTELEENATLRRLNSHVLKISGRSVREHLKLLCEVLDENSEQLDEREYIIKQCSKQGLQVSLENVDIAEVPSLKVTFYQLKSETVLFDVDIEGHDEGSTGEYGIIYISDENGDFIDTIQTI